MNRDELWEQLQSASPDSEYLTELENKLKAEMQKPLEEQNSDLIDELTATISAINGTDELIARSVHQGIRKVHNTLIKNRTRSIFKKSRVAVGICAVFLLAVNIVSYTAYGMNAFTAVYFFTDKGVTVDYNRSTEETIPADTGNPYAEAMRNICKDYGYEALIPNYLPEGFEPNPDIEFGHRTISDDPLILIFNFSNTHKHLFRRRDTIVFNISFYQTDQIIQRGFPSDEHNITEQVIDDTVITISKEDDQFHAMFMIDRTLYHLYTSGVDYEEAQQILESVFEEQQAV